MRTKIPESAFRHYLRVRMGERGATGRLLKCEKRDGSGHFWKVKLDSGAWVWPDELIADGPGSYVSICTDCGIPFMAEKPNEPLCGRCEGAIGGAPAEIRKPLAYLHGARTPTKRPEPATPEQIAEVERLRREFEDESPF